MMAILPILFIVILDLNQVHKRHIAEKDLSHSHEVTDNVQAIFNKIYILTLSLVYFAEINPVHSNKVTF